MKRGRKFYVIARVVAWGMILVTAASFFIVGLAVGLLLATS